MKTILIDKYIYDVMKADSCDRCHFDHTGKCPNKDGIYLCGTKVSIIFINKKSSLEILKSL